MSLAVTEVRRSKLRFGLLTGAVALLVFLVLFLSTLSTALIRSITGALEGLSADVLVYAANARDNIQASRLEPGVVADVDAVPGVAAAGGVALRTTGADVAGTRTDVSLFGFTPDRPGAPTDVNQGRLPQTASEAAVDGSGVAVGDAVVLQPGDQRLTVVGLLRGAQFNAAPTVYVVQEAYDESVRLANPRAPFVPVNAVAVTVEPGQDPAAVAAAIGKDVPGTTGYTRSDAVAKIPGVASITQSFGILVGLTFVIGVVVVGFFFLILTVQKLKVFTLLRAVGASTGRLAATVSWQITLVVLVASAIAIGLVYLALQGINTGIPVSLPVGLTVGTVLAVLLASLGAGLLSVRRIAAIDPATAAGAR